MTIKALIFDVGGVILRTHDLSPRQKWAARLGVTGPWDVADAVFENAAGIAATAGQVGEAAVWAHAQSRFSLSEAELAEFRQDFFAGDQFDEAILDWVAARRGKYRTAILSNAWDNARAFFSGQPKLVAAFEIMVISAEEKVGKPHPVIYQRTLERLGVLAPEAVFVDDNLANIDAARQLGLIAVRFTADLNLFAEMARLGIN